VCGVVKSPLSSDSAVAIQLVARTIGSMSKSVLVDSKSGTANSFTE
jgi:hypothetical protein